MYQNVYSNMSDDDKKEKDVAKSADPEPTITDISTSEKKAEIKTNDKTSKTENTVPSFSLLDADVEEEPRNSSFEVEEIDSDVDDNKVEEKTEETLDEDDAKTESKSNKNISSDEVKDWLKDVRPDTTKEQEKGGGGSVFKWLAVFVILLLIAGAVAGGIYYYNQNVTQVGEEVADEEEIVYEEVSEQESTEPTPTPEEVDLSIFTVSVLNGSGVAGEAGRVANTLEEVGFASPNAGNADKQNYTDTIIEYKATVPQSVIDEVISALEDSYSIEMSDDVLEEEGEYDIVVTVGQSS